MYQQSWQQALSPLRQLPGLCTCQVEVTCSSNENFHPLYKMATVPLWWHIYNNTAEPSRKETEQRGEMNSPHFFKLLQLDELYLWLQLFQVQILQKKYFTYNHQISLVLMQQIDLYMKKFWLPHTAECNPLHQRSAAATHPLTHCCSKIPDIRISKMKHVSVLG